jgi:hypothetical protein
MIGTKRVDGDQQNAAGRFGLRDRDQHAECREYNAAPAHQRELAIGNSALPAELSWLSVKWKVAISRCYYIRPLRSANS